MPELGDEKELVHGHVRSEEGSHVLVLGLGAGKRSAGEIYGGRIYKELRRRGFGRGPCTEYRTRYPSYSYVGIPPSYAVRAQRYFVRTGGGIGGISGAWG